MIRYRTERVSAGKRVAELEWSICPSCRHVRLERWSMRDRAGTEEEHAHTSGGDLFGLC
jgi:hypothetical protein